MEDSTPGRLPLVEAPDSAPNILLVMMDDVGFGATSTFGGVIPTPNLDRLAKNGLRYNNFHSTAICSPSRAALMTGRNHHAAGFGYPPESATGYPGYVGQLPPDAAPIAKVLRENGYSTAMFGKHHNASSREPANSGPFDNWPSGWGFDYFYGFVAADVDQFRPNLFRGVDRVQEEDDAILDERLANDAIRWIHNQDAATRDKPFFIYMAPGSTHAPHQAPQAWIEKFKGRFDLGWDKLREQIFSDQKQQGIIPRNTRITARPGQVPAWNSLTPAMQQVHARAMEVYAAQLAHFDAQFGRVVTELERMGELDQTLVIFIAGDNGGSADSGPRGTTNELGDFVNGLKETDEQFVQNIDAMGGPRHYGNYSAGWSYALNSPFPWFKRIASHLGGTRNGMILSWPQKVRPDSTPRSGFAHLTDIYPTLLAGASLPVPRTVHGVEQQSLAGSSLIPTFSDAGREVHPTQYFEMVGNRAIYHQGWMASTTPTTLPWAWSGNATRDTHWELYNLRDDFAQSRDLASEEPERLQDMIALWHQQAKDNKVFPVDPNSGANRGNSRTFSGLKAPATEYTYWGKNVRVETHSAPMFGARSFTVSARIRATADTSGAIVANGSWYGGWGFYLDDGVPTVVQAYSQLPGDSYKVTASRAVPGGSSTVRFAFESDGGPLAGGRVKFFIDDQEAGSGDIPKTILIPAGSGETFDIGLDTGVPVSDEFDRAPFEGEIDRVDVHLAPFQRPARD
ncbi:MAG: arylsulfatase [Novosphingobium sp.]|nr:arylsulfatase [Novosphingobium sp.]